MAQGVMSELVRDGGFTITTQLPTSAGHHQDVVRTVVYLDGDATVQVFPAALDHDGDIPPAIWAAHLAAVDDRLVGVRRAVRLARVLPHVAQVGVAILALVAGLTGGGGLSPLGWVGSAILSAIFTMIAPPLARLAARLLVRGAIRHIDAEVRNALLLTAGEKGGGEV